LIGKVVEVKVEGAVATLLSYIPSNLLFIFILSYPGFILSYPMKALSWEATCLSLSLVYLILDEQALYLEGLIRLGSEQVYTKCK